MHPRATSVSLFLTGLLALAVGPPATADDEVLSVMRATNDDLKAMWMDFRIESIDYLTVGQGRPSDRLLRQPLRWVAGDARRRGEVGRLSFLADGSWGTVTASGIEEAEVASVLGTAMATWAADPCLRPELLSRPWDGGDVTVTDFFMAGGPLGDPFAADVVFGGFLGADSLFFDRGTLAVTVTYVFVDPASGEPTDVDRDRNLDVALAEIYFNDAFDWTTGASGGVDLLTASLHEVGHTLGLGHFGPPPASLMNPVYTGPHHTLEAIDHAALCTVWKATD